MQVRQVLVPGTELGGIRDGSKALRKAIDKIYGANRPSAPDPALPRLAADKETRRVRHPKMDMATSNPEKDDSENPQPPHPALLI